EDRLGVAEQASPLLSEGDSPGEPVKQPCPDLGLERGDLAGDRGLGQSQLLCGASDGAAPSHSTEGLQRLSVHHRMLCRLAMRSQHVSRAKKSLVAWLTAG